MLSRPSILGLLAALILAPPAQAEDALAAVAANFAGAAEALAPMFHEATGHTVVLTTGSTGKLYAQISEGAPFDVLLSADAATPARLLEDGNAVPGSAFTYAIGRLTLWSADPARVTTDPAAVLGDPDLRFVAIANPDLAPYGVAARDALQNLGLLEGLQPKIVMGQNVGQTYSLIASGAAEVGFVALSGVIGETGTGSRWDVPQDLYSPIRQDAVLLNHGADNPAARAFLEFLRSPTAAEVIASFGYDPGG